MISTMSLRRFWVERRLLKRQATSPEFIESLSVIEQAALDGAGTVRRIQEFSRQTTDTSDEQVLADLTQVVRDTVAQMSLELGVSAAAAASPSSSTSASRCGSTLTHVSCERSLRI